MSYVCDVVDILQQSAVLSQDEKDEAESICRTSLESVEALLRPDTDRTDIRILRAAAADALYTLCIKRSSSASGGITSFKAGDLAVTQEENNMIQQIKNAEKAREQAFAALAPLITDSGFFCGKVDVYDTDRH